MRRKMKIINNIWGNYWIMKIAPLALALAAGMIFFFGLFGHVGDAAVIYIPLLWLAVYGGNKLIKILCCIFFLLLLLEVIYPYEIITLVLFMAVSAAAFFIGIFSFIGSLGK